MSREYKCSAGNVLPQKGAASSALRGGSESCPSPVYRPPPETEIVRGPGVAALSRLKQSIQAGQRMNSLKEIINFKVRLWNRSLVKRHDKIVLMNDAYSNARCNRPSSFLKYCLELKVIDLIFSSVFVRLCQ